MRSPRRQPPDGPRGTLREDDGFVLAAVLLTLVAIGALAAAAFVLTRTDLLVSLSHRSSVEAGDVAERGVARYLADHELAGGDETYVFGSDTAVVAITRLIEIDPAYSDTLLRITSEGIHWSGGNRARRVISRLVVEGVQRMSLSFASASGVSTEVTGSASVTGEDACTGSPGTGLVLPSGGYFPGDADNVEGSPAVDSSYASPTALLEATGVDWQEIIQDTLVEPDHYVPPDSWPSSFSGGDYPVIRITDPTYTLDGAESGQGTIIAEGALELRGNFDWSGLVLAGGGVDVGGQARVRGAVVQGLDVLLGGSPGVGTVSSTGSAELVHDSCEVDEAVSQGFRWLAEVPGSWSEEMAP